MTADIMRTIEPLLPALRRYARALMRDAWDADDLVQDCLERAIGRWHQRRNDGNAHAWMFTILHHLADPIAPQGAAAAHGADRHG